MADIKITDVLKGKGDKVALAFEQGGTKYVLSHHGLQEFAEHGVTPKLVEGTKASQLVNQALYKLAGKDTASLPASVKESLPKVSGLFTGVDAEVLALVKQKGILVAAAESGVKADIEAALKGLPKGVSAKDVLTPALIEKAEKSGLIFKDIEAAAAAEAAAIAKLATAREGLTKLLEAKTPDAAAINKYLKANYEHIDELGKLTSPAGYDLQAAVSGIKTDVAHHATQATEHLNKHFDHLEAAQKAEVLGDTAGAKAARESADASLKEADKLLKGEHGPAVSKAVDAATVERAAGHNPKLAESLGAKASGAADASRSFVSKMFLKKPDVIAKEGLTGWRTISKTKAGLAAGAVVAVGYVAGIGRGPGKHTEQVAQQQLEGQSVGVA